MSRLILGLTLFASLAAGHPAVGIVVDAKGNVYVAGGPANGIFKIDTQGRLSRLLSDDDRKKLVNPHHLVMGDGCLYSVSDHGSRVWKIGFDGEMTQHFPPKNQSGVDLIGLGGDPMTVDGDGNIYCLNGRQNVHMQILKVNPQGRITVLAGGDWGWKDGKGEEARFGGLHSSGFAWGPGGVLYLTDDFRRVRTIAPDGTTKTIAGGAIRGVTDGRGAAAAFSMALGLCVKGDGSVFVADARARRIRKVAPDGTVSTYAGSGMTGTDDGPAAVATFGSVCGVTLGTDGSLYTLEYGRRDETRIVRRIDTKGNVKTIATFEAKPAPRR